MEIGAGKIFLPVSAQLNSVRRSGSQKSDMINNQTRKPMIYNVCYLFTTGVMLGLVELSLFEQTSSQGWGIHKKFQNPWN
jgi:hypothetical protein